MNSRLTRSLWITVVLATTFALLLLARGAEKTITRSDAAPVGVPIDPSTGLPLPPPIQWKDPDKVLPEVVYDGIPLQEVVRQLRAEFKGAFDVVLPRGWQDPNNPAVSVDPETVAVKMQLKNVTASEVFNAMNLMFEAENAPYRWELKFNGNRPTAMLRVLPHLLPVVAPTRPPPQTRAVYYVGDLLANDKSGGMTMEQLVKTLSEVYEMSYGAPKGVLQFHKGAQLIIVTGTADQLDFVRQTLAALQEKERAVAKPEPKAKPETPKTR